MAEPVPSPSRRCCTGISRYDDDDVDRRRRRRLLRGRRVSGVGYDVLSTRVIDPPPRRGAAACARRRIIVVVVVTMRLCVYYFYTILIYAIAHVHPPTAKTPRRQCK